MHLKGKQWWKSDIRAIKHDIRSQSSFIYKMDVQGLLESPNHCISSLLLFKMLDSYGSKINYWWIILYFLLSSHPNMISMFSKPNHTLVLIFTSTCLLEFLFLIYSVFKSKKKSSIVKNRFGFNLASLEMQFYVI